MSKNSFLLTKWYLDCVAENGDTVIIYAADLRWLSVSIHYASTISCIEGKIANLSTSHGGWLPVAAGDTVSLNHPGIGVEGTWRALRSPLQKHVFESREGLVDWHCLQPMSQVEMLFRGHFRLLGLGYAERLTVSVSPWDLPLASLRWGRFLSPRDAVVWMDWDGTERRRAVIHNGEEQSASLVSDSEVVFGPGSRLVLDQGLVLRKGDLGESVFPGLSRLARLLPRSVLAVHECQWRSRGTLHDPRTEGEASSGWALHQTVIRPLAAG